jgi:hypothetical protein
MGKSDTTIFAEYRNILPKLSYDTVAFLGFHSENQFTATINSAVRHFYDLSLKNWEINSDWCLQQKYDLIVCTRCAYFCKDPDVFITKIKQHLNSEGLALIDWGLGDHWRFELYKVGWVRNGEHEFAYHDKNFLYSCYWNENIAQDEQVKLFWNTVKSNPRLGYSEDECLNDVIKNEVPKHISYKTKKIRTKFLWPESPQLYIVTLVEK